MQQKSEEQKTFTATVAGYFTTKLGTYIQFS